MKTPQKPLGEVIYDAILSKELNGPIIEDFLRRTLAREWDYFDAVRCTMSYEDQCKAKNTLYQLKMFLTLVRNCNLAANPQIPDQGE